MQFSQDERLLVTMGAETSLDYKPNVAIEFSARIWDVVSGKELATCPIPGRCFCLGISPDGCLLATMSAEVRSYYSSNVPAFHLTLWDIPSGRMRAQLSTPSRKIGNVLLHPDSMQFSPDGRWLAVSHMEHIEIWDVAHILRKE